MRKKIPPTSVKQVNIISKTNPRVQAQTRKVLAKHYRAKYRVK